MRIKSVVLTTVLACSALSLGVLPSRAQRAAPPPADTAWGGRSQLPLGPAPRAAPPAGGDDEQFLRLDRDGDGALNFDEMTETLRAERDKWDVNGDGHIDLGEWKRHLDAVAGPARPTAPAAVGQVGGPGGGPPVKEPDRRPRGPDAAAPPVGGGRPPTLAARPEFNDQPRRRPPAAPDPYPKNLPAWFREYDADGDGQVGLYEWKAQGDDLGEYDRYDLNHDGFVTVGELARSGQFGPTANAPPAVSGLKAEVGDYFYLEVTGSDRGVIRGTDVYTADSALGAAAVHAGVLAAGETGLVKVTVLPGRERYEGSDRNGVTAQDFGALPRSFRVEAVR